MPYIGVSPAFGVRRKHTYTATAGQTSFSGAGSEGATLSYTDSNFVDVYQNGVKLGDADYTSTSGTAIVLAQGASVDDLVEIIVFDAFSAADTVSKADGGQFDGNVTMGGTLDVTGNGTVGGTLGVTGVLTANAGIKVDNITIDGTEIDLSSGDVTIDAALDIKLDAAGGDIKFLSDGTEFGEIRTISNDLTIISSVADKDIVFKGQDDTSEIEALRIDMSLGGFVGIGNSGPSTKLHVRTAQASNIAGYRGGTTGLIVEGDTASYIQIVADENAPMGLLFDGGSSTTDTARMAILADLNGTLGELSLKAGGSSRMSITGAGNVVMHGNGSDIRQTFYTGGNISIGEDQANRAAMYIQTHLQSYNGILIKNGTNNGGGIFINFANYNLSGVGSISQTSDGSGVNFNTSSDYRLKENVSDMTDATTRLKKLQPKRFNFIADESNTLVDGFLAHEVSDIVPEAITGEKDGVQDIGIIKDEDGNVIDTDAPKARTKEKETWTKTGTVNVYQGIDQSKLVPLLVKTIQELEARITALESK